MSDLEYCTLCDEPTGRAGRGEDSLYIDFGDGSCFGPLCEKCFDENHEANSVADLVAP